MYKWIVQHPVKGRITVPAGVILELALAAVGDSVSGGVVVGVAGYGRPIADNASPEYRHTPTKPTRKVDHLPSCVKRTGGVSSHMPLVPPVVKTRYEGHSLHHGAGVAVGVVYEATAQERLQATFIPVVLSTPSLPPPPLADSTRPIQKLYGDRQLQEDIRAYGMENTFTPFTPVKPPRISWFKDEDLTPFNADGCLDNEVNKIGGGWKIPLHWVYKVNRLKDVKVITLTC